METIYRSKFEAYPFLSDDSNNLMCDFEILTDEISSYIGLLNAKITNPEINSQLTKICEIVYHINPSLRTFVSVTKDELDWIEQCMKLNSTGIKKFVLNHGSETACLSHIIRTKFKKLTRMLYQHIQNGNNIENILLDFTNLLSGYFFHLALKLNKINGVEEIEFISRNYKPI